MAIISRQPTYSDLDLDFLPHPTTKDVQKKTGVAAINRSIRNLILTNFYDRPFRPGIGSGATKLLFENANPLTSNFLQNAVKEVIRNYEPRVQLLDIQVNFDYDNNGYNLKLAYISLNKPEPIITTIFLERIR